MAAGKAKKTKKSREASASQIEKNSNRLLRAGGEILGPMLQSAYEELLAKQTSATSDVVMFFWSVGAHVAKIAAAEVTIARQQGLAVRNIGQRALAKVLRIEKNQVQDGIRFYGRYPGTESRAVGVVNERNSKGQPIPWGVWRLLLQESVGDAFEDMRRQCLADAWTAKDAAFILGVAKGNAGEASTNEGRPVVPPKTLIKGLAAWLQMSSKFGRYNKAIWKKSVLKRIVADTDPTTITSDMFKSFNLLKRQLTVVAEAVATELGLIDEVVVMAKARAVEAPATAPVEAAATDKTSKSKSKPKVGEPADEPVSEPTPAEEEAPTKPKKKGKDPKAEARAKARTARAQESEPALA